MNYISEFSEVLKEKLKRIQKKNRVLFDVTINKIKEIEKTPDHYKQLRYNLKGIRRVHLLKSFVLVFTIIERENKIKFLDLDHHDKIYGR